MKFRVIAPQLAERALRLLSGAFVTSAVAKHLGPIEFGSLSIAASYVALATAAANMGADHLTVAEMSRRNEADKVRFTEAALKLRILWSTVCLLVTLAAIFIAKPDFADLIFIGSLTIPFSVSNVIVARLHSEGNFSNQAILGSVTILGGAASKLWGIFNDCDTRFFAWTAMFECSLLFALMAAVHRRIFAPLKLTRKFDLADCLSYARMCAPTAVSAVLIVLYLRVELIMVDQLIGKEAAGIWAALVMFLTPWNVIAATLLPHKNKYLAELTPAHPEYRAEIIKTIRQFCILGVAAATINALLSTTLIPLLLGTRYKAAAELLPLCSLGLIPLFMGNVQELWIAHTRRTSLVLKKVILGIPLSIGLYLLLVPRYELRGAVLAMLISYLTTAIFFNAFLDRAYFRLQLAAIGLKNG